VSAPQSYNQHYGPAGDHTAVMPEGLAAFFIKACCPAGGVVIDPFAGSATTTVVARRLQRLAGGIELHEEHVAAGRQRIAADVADDVVRTFQIAM
jgi:DNA modification methylase